MLRPACCLIVGDRPAFECGITNLFRNTSCIGLTFVLVVCKGILLLSGDVHADKHLQDLLVGQILWGSHTQLIATALLNATLLAMWHSPRARLGGYGFNALFALAITASVQLVGIYLVFASLILPALATHKLHNRYIPAFMVRIAGYALGLLLLVWLDLPTGTANVWTMALCGLMVLLTRRPD